MRQLLRTWHAVLFGCAAVLLLVAIIVAAWSARSTAQALAAVTHTYDVILTTNRIASRLAEAEVEQRSFLFTSADTFLVSFELTVGGIDQLRTRLAGLVRDNPEQSARVREFGDLIDRRVADLRATARLRGELGTEAATRALADDPDMRLVREARLLRDEIVSVEQMLLEERHARLSTQGRASGITVVVTGALALGLATHAFILLRRALSALKRESQLLQEKERAIRADQEKSEFLANMSHEIRTPMNSVLGFTELLRGIATTPKQKQYLEAIDASGRAMLSLINDILDLSKIEAGRLEVISRPASIRALLDDLAKIFGPQASQRGLRLSFEVSPHVPPALLVDAQRQRQILFNVVGNALKFTSHGSVLVRAWCHPTPDDETTVTLFLAVADTGVGIAAEHQELVFEPFRQADASYSRKVGGTGLGLSITRRLTELLGGSVQLESQVGRGTTFTFSFPQVRIAGKLPAEEALPPPTEDLDRLRPSLILVVDDVPLNRELVEGYFGPTRHRLLMATNGREAIAATRQHRPDVVLMDLRMPELDGRAAREAIKADPELAAIPIIAVTASSLLAEEQGLREAFDGYLRKPITRALLFRELARHLPLDAERIQKSDTPAPPSGGATLSRPPFTAAGRAEPASAVPAALLAELQALERDVWPRTTKSLSYRDTEAFASLLGMAGERHGHAGVREFGERLLAEVRRFDVVAQEQTLRDFPALVQSLAATVPAASPSSAP